MILELSETLWETITEETRERMLNRPGVRIRLFKFKQLETKVEKISHFIN